MKTIDALPTHWTDRLPAMVQPYARLARLDRPVGWRLLALPCLMGIALARAGEAFRWDDLRLAVLFVIGAVAMRGAGCVWNDILDRDVDAKIARTAARPIPSGQVTVRQALAFMGALLFVGLLVLLQLPFAAQFVALLSVPLVALYPLMKRITWWPQAWLGMVFSWGVLVAGAAVDGIIMPSVLLLYLGCIAWTIAYDTIYALQDIEDDAIVGVRSTARLFGERWRLWTRAFFGLALVLIVSAALAAGSLLMAFAAALLMLPVVFKLVESVDVEQPETALAAFRANVVWQALLAIGLAVQPASRALGIAL